MDIAIASLPVIDFWFEFGSNYSYLSVMRIEQEAEKARVRVRWQPFLLGPVFQSFGWTTSPFVLQKAKGEYVWRDMERLCLKYDLPWKKPGNFPRSAILPLRVAVLGAEEPWMAEYCRRMMQINFAQDREIDNAALVTEVLVAMKLPAADILKQALSDENKLKLRRQTETAMTKGIFGAPSFFVGDEMFWGNDRLDDALLFCRAQSG
ncbi:2-hydroxychromene-2-carboxylate isomerase [Undibacterium sp. CY18W]|uniref:2-hydroxychromene-2-carboxylate isomerase n=1 Tax=Undibacterium hunanense TaxID=2762292 RepID=A0ABR6ZM65_9BURK|nr:2-hydroxychromene-2-carboxylate isomerase [Undibacterium hunanense]MBC3916990.1 2-hydroxychromene-2-carboxylate isomerase [Undibacterium hunanense]